MNQRGFATLEIICVILIISVLTTVAVPQMLRLIDKARLDYEMKTLLNNLELAKSLNRVSHYDREIFVNGLPLTYETSVYINEDSYEYQVNGQRVGERYKLPQGFMLKRNSSLKNPLEFSKNNNGTLTMISKFGYTRKIIFDTVGRWRGDIE